MTEAQRALVERLKHYLRTSFSSLDAVAPKLIEESIAEIIPLAEKVEELEAKLRLK